MANVKISELPAITSPLTTDLVPVVQAGVTDQITRGNFLKNIDFAGSTTDITDNNATTSKHGYVIKATAPSAGIRNVVAIDNAETVYKNAALVDNTNPEALGSVSPGTSLTAARRDHVHPASGLGGSDTDAIHDNVAGEINAITGKSTPVGADLVVIEDSAGSAFTKKKVALSDLPAAGNTTEIQYNNSGKFGSEAAFAYSSSTNTLSVDNISLAKATMSIGADVGIAATTMTGTLTLTTTSPRYQSLDPDGSSRNVDLPAEAAGLAFWIANRGNGAEVITVRNDAAGTIDTIDNDEAASLICDGTRWIFSKGGVTIV